MPIVAQPPDTGDSRAQSVDRPPYGYFLHYPWCENRLSLSGAECMAVGCSGPVRHDGAFAGYVCAAPPLALEAAPEQDHVVVWVYSSATDQALTADDYAVIPGLIDALKGEVGLP